MTRQLTLGEIVGERGRPRRAETRWAVSPIGECRCCGRDLDTETARVVGDDDGCVPACAACTDGYSRTVSAARQARDQ